MNDSDDSGLSQLPARLRPLLYGIESTLQHGWVLNWDPPNGGDIERCLKWLSVDWQPVDIGELNDRDEGMAVAIHGCLKSGFARMRCEVTAHDSSLERTAVFEMQVTGENYRQLAHKKLKEVWSSYNAHQVYRWEVCLTANGAGAKIDVESGSADRCRRACQCVFYLRATPEVRCRLLGAPASSSGGSAFAVAQANPTINNHIQVAPTPVNVIFEQPADSSAHSARSSEKQKRHTEWRKVYDMLDKEGEPSDKDDFVKRYNKNWRNKAIEDRPAERWPGLDVSTLSRRILDWRKSSK